MKRDLPRTLRGLLREAKYPWENSMKGEGLPSIPKDIKAGHSVSSEKTAAGGSLVYGVLSSVFLHKQWGLAYSNVYFCYTTASFLCSPIVAHTIQHATAYEKNLKNHSISFAKFI